MVGMQRKICRLRSSEKNEHEKIRQKNPYVTRVSAIHDFLRELRAELLALFDVDTRKRDEIGVAPCANRANTRFLKGQTYFLDASCSNRDAAVAIRAIAEATLLGGHHGEEGEEGQEGQEGEEGHEEA